LNDGKKEREVLYYREAAAASSLLPACPAMLRNLNNHNSVQPFIHSIFYLY